MDFPFPIAIFLSTSNNNLLIQNIMNYNAFGIYLMESNITQVTENIIKNFVDCIIEVNCSYNYDVIL